MVTLMLDITTPFHYKFSSLATAFLRSKREG